VEAVTLLGRKANLLILLNDYEGAAKTLRQVEEIHKKQVFLTPQNLGSILRVKFLFDVILLEKSILSKNMSNVLEYRKQASKTFKRLVKCVRKHKPLCASAFRLGGRYSWLIGNQGKAVNYWMKSIKEGERLGTRPDLARTYMEIGKRFMEDKSKYKELNGISASDYLEKARTMFQEMDLQWDQDELDLIFLSVPVISST